MISAIILTRNEEKMIEDCLKSLNWVDEILVIDTGNTDKTNEIAKKYKAKIVKHIGKGSFADWRNTGLKAAGEEWILYVDADERVTKELQKEIEGIEEMGRCNPAYAISRRNFIFKQEFKHSGQYPDYQKRLFRKEKLIKWSGDVHEEPEYEGELGYLKNALIHKKEMTIHEMIEKTDKWSEIEARLMLSAHHPPMNLKRFTSAIVREFWKRMIVELAFLDGIKGIVYAIYQVFSKFTSYAKLYEMQIKS